MAAQRPKGFPSQTCVVLDLAAQVIGPAPGNQFNPDNLFINNYGEWDPATWTLTVRRGGIYWVWAQLEWRLDPLVNWHARVDINVPLGIPYFTDEAYIHLGDRGFTRTGGLMGLDETTPLEVWASHDQPGNETLENVNLQSFVAVHRVR